MIDWVKKRYNQKASSKYTVTNNEIRQQDGLQKLFKMFADPSTNMIKVERLYQLFLDNRITITFDKFQQLISNSNKTQLAFLSFTELQDISQNEKVNQSKKETFQFNIVFRFQKHNEKAETLEQKLDIDSVAKHTSSFVNLFTQHGNYLQNNENDKIVQFIQTSVDNSPKQKIDFDSKLIGRTTYQNPIFEDVKLETEQDDYFVHDKQINYSYSTKNIHQNPSLLNSMKQSTVSKKDTKTLSTLPAISNISKTKKEMKMSILTCEDRHLKTT
eukprot:403336436